LAITYFMRVSFPLNTSTDVTGQVEVAAKKSFNIFFEDGTACLEFQFESIGELRHAIKAIDALEIDGLAMEHSIGVQDSLSLMAK